MDEEILSNNLLNNKMDSNEIINIVAEFLEMTSEQALELRRRIKAVTDDSGGDGGFGDVWIEFRRRKLFRMSHKLDGKPILFNKGEQ
jgi:hypothetical protein